MADQIERVNNLSESLLTAMDIISKQAVASVNYDTTITCTCY